MKTMKDVKARFVVGATVTATNSLHPVVSGARTITKVQSNGYWFESRSVGPGTFWSTFPSRASGFKVLGPDRVELTLDMGAVVTIDFGPQSEEGR
jgi:hypothetical protein